MKTCRICNHIMRDEIEELYRNGKTLKYIQKYCMDNGLELTYNQLQYHFSKHYNKPTSNTEIIPIELIRHLVRNLEICDRKISEMLENDKLNHNVLIRYLSEIRHCISELRSLLREYDVKPKTIEDTFKLILSLLHDLPSEYIHKLEERYKQFRGNPNLSVIQYK